MAEPALSEVWGTGTVKLASGAAAPSEGLFIPASFFEAAPSAITDFTLATAEALYVKLLQHQLTNLTETLRSADPTNRNLALVYTGFDTIEDDLLGTAFGRYSYAVLAYEPTTIPAIDPNNF